MPVFDRHSYSKSEQALDDLNKTSVGQTQSGGCQFELLDSFVTSGKLFPLSKTQYSLSVKWVVNPPLRTI